jgi:hypothetical protein
MGQTERACGEKKGALEEALQRTIHSAGATLLELI